VFDDLVFDVNYDSLNQNLQEAGTMVLAGFITHRS